MPLRLAIGHGLDGLLEIVGDGLERRHRRFRRFQLASHRKRLGESLLSEELEAPLILWNGDFRQVKDVAAGLDLLGNEDVADHRPGNVEAASDLDHARLHLRHRAGQILPAHEISALRLGATSQSESKLVCSAHLIGSLWSYHFFTFGSHFPMAIYREFQNMISILRTKCKSEAFFLDW